MDHLNRLYNSVGSHNFIDFLEATTQFIKQYNKEPCYRDLEFKHIPGAGSMGFYIFKDKKPYESFLLPYYLRYDYKNVTEIFYLSKVSQNLSNFKWVRPSFPFTDNICKDKKYVVYFDNDKEKFEEIIYSYYQSNYPINIVKIQKSKNERGEKIILKETKKFDNYGKIEFIERLRNGRKHSLDRPAYVNHAKIIEFPSFYNQEWSINGSLHRENGPAVICAEYEYNRSYDKTIIRIQHKWYKKGRLHNENGPALINEIYNITTRKLLSIRRTNYLNGKKVHKDIRQVQTNINTTCNNLAEIHDYSLFL